MARPLKFPHVIRHVIIALGAVAAFVWLSASHAQDGHPAYEKTCSTCHAKGVGGAPRVDDSAQWQARLTSNGYSGLFVSAIKGKGSMPPKGGNAALNDDEVMSAVMHMLRLAAVGVGAGVVVPISKVAMPADGASSKGRAIYQSTCAACHTSGVAGAPRLGDSAAWSPRIGVGVATLHNSALKGKGAMPAKGGNPSLPDADVKAAVDYMLAQGRGVASAAGTKTEARKIASNASTEDRGKSVYQATCAACHATGVAGAPKIGDPASWAARVKTGNSVLYANAVKGKGAMPAKGGNPALPEADIKAAVDFMLAQLGVASTAKTSVQTGQVDAPAAAPSVAQATEPIAQETVSAAPFPVASTGVNAFNRLLPSPGKRNLPPLEDGIHDAANDATRMLQTPLQAYAGLPKSNAGNYIDWSKALNDKKILPRADKQDPKAEMIALELNIVREVKGSMPDVVYPHRQHTQWLDCSNCHPAIFIPQKGANQMSMASIILGQKCGVCHGKVAFPISECRRCHSKEKEPAKVSAGVKP